MEEKKYYAHTKKDKPESEWQELKEHLFGTAEIASNFTGKEELKRIIYNTGLLHDFGKFQNAFQIYLKQGGRRGCVPHASWGAGYARQLGLNEISFAIDGHHKGLPDHANWKNDTTEYLNGENKEFEKIIQIFYKDTNIDIHDLTVNKTLNNNKFERELFIRYLFSTLTDADWLDTEKAVNSELSNKRTSRTLDYDYLINKIDRELNQKPKERELNLLRNAAREEAIRNSNSNVGFYSLSLPTGMGKTFTSIAWALRHAKANQLKRIIIVLPFINIIDQTAEILKSIFGTDMVLEHHSGNNDTFDTTEKVDDYIHEQRLACENWDFPIIITTTVQFFESLFSNKPSRCRKMHNIAESIVIFDEVQTLPKELTIPTLTMLKNMNALMNTSFLFCTATQPAFEKREGFDGIENIQPLISKPDEIYKKTRRVTYHILNEDKPLSFPQLIAETEKQNSSVLCIFNTKKAALEFFKQIKKAKSWDKVFHLSTSMCPNHRKKTILEIRTELEKNIKICIASTQLIEAGVDFDFPSVFREIGPLESIIQSAGRCNREWKNKEFGNVFIFRIEDGKMPDKIYKSSAEAAMDLILENIDRLYDHDFYNEYYKQVISLFVDPDKNKINGYREEFKFETVSGLYHIIKESNESLFIRGYSELSEQLYVEIENKGFITRNDFRRIQEYSVQVYTNFLIENKGMFTESLPGFKVWHGSYDEHTGITTDPLTAESTVI